jgi:hypothetical protein
MPRTVVVRVWGAGSVNTIRGMLTSPSPSAGCRCTGEAVIGRATSVADSTTSMAGSSGAGADRLGPRVHGAPGQHERSPHARPERARQADRLRPAKATSPHARATSATPCDMAANPAASRPRSGRNGHPVDRGRRAPAGAWRLGPPPASSGRHPGELCVSRGRGCACRRGTHQEPGLPSGHRTASAVHGRSPMEPSSGRGPVPGPRADRPGPSTAGVAPGARRATAGGELS